MESVQAEGKLIPEAELIVLRRKLRSAKLSTIGLLQEEIRARITEISGSEWSSAMQTYNMVLEANLNPYI